MPTETSARRLREAAETVRKYAGDATPGPWHRPLNTRTKSSVRAPLPEGERGEWINGVDPSTGQRENCTVATIPLWSNGAHARKRNGRDLEWIALMHPGVGEALAVVFDEWARMGELDPDLLNRVGGPETVALADLILGTPAAGGAR